MPDFIKRRAIIAIQAIIVAAVFGLTAWMFHQMLQ
jgi:hypothetical protein